MTRFDVTAATHVGCRRATNEDRVVVGHWVLAPQLPGIAAVARLEPCVVAVIDGMGGHAAGDIAAVVAAESVASAAASIDGADAIRHVVQAANQAVYDRMAVMPALAGMGATIAGLAAVGEADVAMFNVGDARVYFESAGYLVAATTDDAVPDGGALTQSLGGRGRFEAVDVHVLVEPHDGRRFVLASDGLFGHLADEVLDACLTDDDAETVTALVRAALDAGGPDNISLALVRTSVEDGSQA